MFILKNIVGKLWMTIIALVGVVLIILGLFLFQYIDNSFPNSNGQPGMLRQLANKVAEEASIRRNEETFAKAMDHFLSSLDAGLIILNRYDEKRGTDNLSAPLFQSAEEKVTIQEVFTQAEINSVFNGEIIERLFSVRGNFMITDYLFVAHPVKIKDSKTNETDQILILHQSQKSIENTQLYVKRLFAFVSVIGFLLTTFFAFFLITRITKPLQQLNQAAHLMGQGQYGTRVPIVSKDELGELATTFNHMGDRLEETIKYLNYEKENLSSVLRSIADAVISFDVDGQVIFTNPHGARIIENWSSIQWNTIDKHNSLEGIISESYEKATRQIPEPLQQLFDDVVLETKEISSKLHVHNEVWSIVMAPLYSRQVVRGTVAVLRDVTEEHRLEKLRKDFVANVSHELRTPLSMLQGYSEALLDDIAASPEERTEIAQVIYDESLRMGRLVTDLLDLARIEAGRMELTFLEVSLTQLLKRVHRKFAVLCKEQGIPLVSEYPEEEVVLSSGDEDRLEQVFTNLLDNAIRHSVPGAAINLRLIVTHHLLSMDGRHAILIEIEDNGHGIAAEDLPFIFERFYKVDKARTRGTSGGTGLGLAIVRNIVEAHHGTIQANSTVGKGTTFSILIPL